MPPVILSLLSPLLTLLEYKINGVVWEHMGTL